MITFKDKKYEHFFSNDIEGVARRGLDIQNMIEIWVREIGNRGQTPHKWSKMFCNLVCFSRFL